MIEITSLRKTQQGSKYCLRMSFEERLENIKKIPNKYWCIVYGFVHETETALHQINDIQNPYYNIPDLVTMVVLCFYYNAFGFVKYGQDIKISGEDNRIATKIGEDGFSSAYIGDWTNSTDQRVIKCKLKLDQLKNEKLWSCTILLGIASNDELTEEAFITKSTKYTYAIANAGIWVNNPDKNKSMDFSLRLEARLIAGGTATLILDLPKGELRFVSNDGKEVTVCKIVRRDDLRYKIAISLFRPGEFIEIVKYQERLV